MPLPLLAYLCTTFTVLGMDFVWLSLAANPVYRAQLGDLMLAKPNLAVAGGFYLFYGVALVVFAVLPALSQNDWTRALWAGALLGFTAYGTYDLTNQATLAGWSTVVTVVDLAWGTCLSGAGAVIGFFLTRLLKNHL